MQQLIVRKLRDLKINFKKSGTNWLLCQCLNPNHRDTHESMGINTVTGAGKCHGCGYTVHPSFFTGELSEDARESLEEKIRKNKYDDLIELSERKSLKTYAFFPLKSEEVEIYRGIPNDFGGYICRTGLFEDRIIFPLESSPDDPLKGLYSGRYIGDDPVKFKKAKWFHAKGFKNETVCYPLNLPPVTHQKPVLRGAVLRGTCFLVEGIADALSLRALGYTSLCNFGVGFEAQFKEHFLEEFGIHTLIVMLDKDLAGAEATKKLLTVLSNAYKNVKVKAPIRVNDELIQQYLTDKDSKDFSDFFQKISE